MHFVVALTLLTLLASCSSIMEGSNSDFVKKYHEEVKRINEQRTPDKELKNETLFSAPPTREEVVQDLASKTQYHPYSDISLLGDAPKNEMLPNRETYELGTNQNSPSSLPHNIFETTYDLALYPPFRKIGAEFDSIELPQADAYGVSTDLGDKKYLLVGSNSLQRSVDYINSEKSDTDVEITKMLVVEKKKILRREKSNQSLLERSEAEPLLVAEKKDEKDTKETNNQRIPDKIKAVVTSVPGFVRSVVTTPTPPAQK